MFAHARKFIHAVKGIEKMCASGISVTRPFQTDDGPHKANVDKDSMQSVALKAINELFDYRVGRFNKKKDFIFDGSHVTVEVVVCGAYSEVKAMQLRESWLGTWSVYPVSFPTALDTNRDEFAYRPSSAVFGTLLHKNLATLLQLFLFTDSTFRSVCMGVLFHRGSEVRCHAYLQVGMETRCPGSRPRSWAALPRSWGTTWCSTASTCACAQPCRVRPCLLARSRVSDGAASREELKQFCRSVVMDV